MLYGGFLKVDLARLKRQLNGKRTSIIRLQKLGIISKKTMEENFKLLEDFKKMVKE